MPTRAVKDSPVFQYEPLPGRGWFRLLRLHPGLPAETVSCELLPMRLRRAHKYKALSYVWGDPADKDTIFCDGIQIDVTCGLKEAFRRIRHESEVTVVWADALCINQRNRTEQAQQVEIMANIYEQAEEVLIWLGDDEFGDAEVAVSSILAINECCDIAYANRLDEDGEAFDPGIPADSPLLEDSRWKAILHLFDKAWFSRVWVIQEVGLAAHATVFYGDTALPWVELVQFIMSVDKQIDLGSTAPIDLPIGPTTDVFNSIWKSYDNPRSWRNQLRHVARPSEDFTKSSFFDILLAGSWMGATDPRDRVYAFLGHPAASRGQKKKSIMTPDYEITKEQLYTELTINLLEESGSLYTLSGVRHSEGTIEDEFYLMPSWVPRWDQPSVLIVLASPVDTIQVFYDADDHEHTTELSHSPFTVTHILKSASKACLQVEALLFDTVKFQSPIIDIRDLDIVTRQGEFSNLVDYLQSFLFNRDIDLSDQPVDALSQTLCAGLIDFDCPIEDDVEQHRADYHAFLEERCGHECDSGHASAQHRLSPNADTAGNAQNYATAAGRYTDGRRFFVTKHGRFGLGPPGVLPGDRCAVLFGSRVPFIVRATEGSADTSYLLLGETYVHGVMRGEAVRLWRDKEIDLTTITLI